MTNYAYLRVSTNRQEVENQKLGLLDYCTNRSFTPITFEDTPSSKTSWQDPAIAQILDKIEAGDCIIAAEVSQFGRDLASFK